MKTTMFAAAVLAVLGAPGFAGGSVAVAVDPVPVAPAAPAATNDWSGAYVGLAYGTASGPFTVSEPLTGTVLNFDLESGNVTSIFAGYLLQRGSLVYGGELTFSRANDVSPEGFPAESVDSIFDVKAKLGYAADRVLFYGVLGYSEIDYDAPETLTSFTTSGFAYGLGVDYAVTNQLSVGLEYLARNTDGLTNNYINNSLIDPGQTADIDLDTLSLRVGFSF